MTAVYGGLHTRSRKGFWDSLSSNGHGWQANQRRPAGLAHPGIAGAARSMRTNRPIIRTDAPRALQVFLEIVMVGNFAEKSFDLAATVMAILRAIAL